MVIRLNTDRGPSLARLKQKQQQLSVDDVEAAARLETRSKRASLTQLTMSSTSLTVDLRTESEETLKADEEEAKQLKLKRDSSVNLADYVKEQISAEKSPAGRRRRQRTTIKEATDDGSPRQPSAEPTELRPLPHHRFRKRDDAAQWDSILQKRLTEDVKDKELKHSILDVVDSSDADSLFTEDLKEDLVKPEVTVEQKPEVNNNTGGAGSKSATFMSSFSSLSRMRGLTLMGAEEQSTGPLTKSTVTNPWGTKGVLRTANPAYALTSSASDKDVIEMTSQSDSSSASSQTGQVKKPRVLAAVAIFENMGQEKNTTGGQEVSRNGAVKRAKARSRSQPRSGTPPPLLNDPEVIEVARL